MKPPYDLGTSQLCTREPNFFEACCLIANTQSLVTAIQFKRLRANPAKVHCALSRDKRVEYKCLGMWQVMISTTSSTFFLSNVMAMKHCNVCGGACIPAHRCANVAAGGGACTSVCVNKAKEGQWLSWLGLTVTTSKLNCYYLASVRKLTEVTETWAAQLSPPLETRHAGQLPVQHQQFSFW